MSDPQLDIPALAKSASAFKTISEVSAETTVPQHVLRFWEAKFTQLRPLKRGGGRRYYRPEDVALLQRIRRLLHEEGYTIKGVQKVLREGKSDEVPHTSKLAKMPSPAPDAFPRTRQALATGTEMQPLKSGRLILDIEQMKSPEGRDRLLKDVLEDLVSLRRTLEDI